MNMFMDTLERAFDEYFQNKYPNKDLNSPMILSKYRQELEDFSRFLVQEYKAALDNEEYWAQRQGLLDE